MTDPGGDAHAVLSHSGRKRQAADSISTEVSSNQALELSWPGDISGRPKEELSG